MKPTKVAIELVIKLVIKLVTKLAFWRRGIGGDSHPPPGLVLSP